MLLDKILKKLKWDNFVYASLTIIVGLLCLIMPEGTAYILSVIFGVFLIAVALSTLIRHYMYRYELQEHTLIINISILVLGISCLIFPRFIQNILTILFGIYIIIDSIPTLIEGINYYKSRIVGYKLMIIGSIISIVLGLVLIFTSFSTVMIFAGIALIIEGVKKLFMNGVNKKDKSNGKKDRDVIDV